MLQTLRSFFPKSTRERELRGRAGKPMLPLKVRSFTSQTTLTRCRANKPQLPQGEPSEQWALCFLPDGVPLSGRSFPARNATSHHSTNTAQPEPPSPALTSPWGLLTILHLIYRLYYNVVCIYDLILIWTISRSREGADSLFFSFILF